MHCFSAWKMQKTPFWGVGYDEQGEVSWEAHYEAFGKATITTQVTEQNRHFDLLHKKEGEIRGEITKKSRLSNLL